MNHYKKEKLIYWLMGVGTGVVLSGMVMMGIGLKLATPIEQVLEHNKETYEVKPIIENQGNALLNQEANPQGDLVTTTSDLKVNTDQNTGWIEVTIPPTSGSDKIAELLYENDVVQDKDKFLEYVKKQKRTKVLQHGTMSFPKNGQYNEILDILLMPHR